MKRNGHRGEAATLRVPIAAFRDFWLTHGQVGIAEEADIASLFGLRLMKARAHDRNHFRKQTSITCGDGIE
jgi:hypothetical protein